MVVHARLSQARLGDSVLLLIPLGAAGVLSLRNTTPKRIGHYSAAPQTALDAGDSSTNGLRRSKLRQFGDRDLDRLDFDEILAFARESDIDQAFQRMQELAPLDGKQAGLLDAHLWIGALLLDGKVTVPDVVDRLERHAQAIFRFDPENPLALRMVAETHLARGEFDQAIEKMELVRRQFPDVVYALALLYEKRATRLGQAKMPELQSVCTRPLTTPRRKPGRPFSGTSNWRRATKLSERRRNVWRLYSGQFGGSLTISSLTDALQQRVNSAVASLQANGLASMSPSTVQLISELAPDHEQLARLLARGLYLSDKTTQRYVQQLMQAEAISPEVFEMVGSTCMVRQEYRRAEKYFVKTCELRESSPSAWNNLAWIWANVRPLHPQEALTAADRAIELHQDPRFYETRGQIHLRFRHWTEAVEDLELAVNGEVANANDAHRGLARAYHELGNQVLAKTHLQQLAPGDDVRGR